VFFYVFAQTTHVVAAPRGFARVGIPATRLYIPSFIEIRSGVSEPQGVKMWPFYYFGYSLLQQLVLRTSRDIKFYMFYLCHFYVVKVANKY